MLRAQLVSSPPAQAVLAWGRKPSAAKAQRLAHKLGLPLLRAEDGFVRSFGPAPEFASLSVVLDASGIYYDSTAPSDLETMLANPQSNLASNPMADAAMTMLLQHGLSKYNYAPHLQLPPTDAPRVLVLDQTFGDMSVQYGAANKQTFSDMLQAAIDENPGAQVWVKTHPEVSLGRKRGYLSDVLPIGLPQGGQLHVMREAAQPFGLLQQASKVYAVTSGMGFEALLCGKPVVCFGVPWYAGWGLTDDRYRQSTAWARRAQQRSVKELFVTAYLRYTRYLNPTTYQQGSIIDAMQWVVRQRQMAGLL